MAAPMLFFESGLTVTPCSLLQRWSLLASTADFEKRQVIKARKATNTNITYFPGYGLWTGPRTIIMLPYHSTKCQEIGVNPELSVTGNKKFASMSRWPVTGPFMLNQSRWRKQRWQRKAYLMTRLR